MPFGHASKTSSLRFFSCLMAETKRLRQLAEADPKIIQRLGRIPGVPASSIEKSLREWFLNSFLPSRPGPGMSRPGSDFTESRISPVDHQTSPILAKSFPKTDG